MTWARVETAFGAFDLEATAAGLRRLRWSGPDPLPAAEPGSLLDQAGEALRVFLAGGPFPQDLPLDLDRLPPFHRKVAAVLLASRPGQTLTYGDVALLAGSPGAARAVGQAVRTNPLPILVPCHRVVAAHGPGGYSFPGGLDLKARLLALEGHTGR